MSGPRRVHLLCAQEVLAEGHWPGGYVAVCGEVISVLSHPDAACTGGCDCEIVYCPACVRAAMVHNREFGITLDCPPAIVVRPR